MTRNTTRILDAAVAVAAEQGWSGMSLRGVARAADLSIRPLIVRYGDRSTLAEAVWRERADPALEHAVGDALGAAGLMGDEADPQAFADAMTALALSEPVLDASAELLISSAFDPQLRAAVTETTGARTIALLRPTPRTQPRALCARRAYVMALGLGLIAMSRRPGVGDMDLPARWTMLFAALRAERSPVTLPRRPRPPHLDFVRFDTGDATADDLLRSTLVLVARKGFEGATLVEIGQDAGVAPATAILRHSTKQALFIDAVARLQGIAMRGHHEVHARISAAHGDAIATATRIRGVLHPEDADSRLVDLERLRLTWHDPALMQHQETEYASFADEMRRAGTDPATFASPAALHVAIALGIGIELLPLLAADAWNLPYDVVTVPLADG